MKEGLPVVSHSAGGFGGRSDLNVKVAYASINSYLKTLTLFFNGLVTV